MQIAGHNVDMRRTLFAAALCASACSNTEQLGTAAFCFATDDDESTERLIEPVNVTLSGLTAVTTENETEPPESFLECAAGMREKAELVDENNEHVWLAAVARYGARELLPPGILGIANNSDLHVEINGGGLSPIAQTLFLSNGAQPLVALQNGADPSGKDFGAVRVENAGANALSSYEHCGGVTTISIRFTDDDSSESASAGEVKELIVGGVEFLGANIFSVDRGETTTCDDGPRAGVSATWVVFDNSL
jgi:hypothetical protein